MSAIVIPETVARLRLSSACDLQKVRPMTRAVCDFLATEGTTGEELSACELALVEACNNAVIYATKTGKGKPVDVEATLDEYTIELKVHDHTNGFNLPNLPNLPSEETET